MLKTSEPSNNTLLLRKLTAAFWSLFSLCFCFPLFYVLLFLFLSFATGVCFSFLQPISRSPFFTNSLILVALRFAYRPLDPYLYLLSICLANTSLVIQSMVCGCFSHPVFYLHSFLYPYFSVISSSWDVALDTNGDETICRVRTSFRNQLSRFLSHQYHLGGMCL